MTPEVSAVGRDTENLSIDRVFKTTGIDFATMRIEGGMDGYAYTVINKRKCLGIIENI